MTVKFAFSFEFDTAAPRTVRGEVTGSSMPVCARRAAEEAMRLAPKADWRSCVLVLDRSGFPGVLSGKSGDEEQAQDATDTSPPGSTSGGGTADDGD